VCVNTALKRVAWCWEENSRYFFWRIYRRKACLDQLCRKMERPAGSCKRRKSPRKRNREPQANIFREKCFSRSCEPLQHPIESVSRLISDAMRACLTCVVSERSDWAGSLAASEVTPKSNARHLRYVSQGSHRCIQGSCAGAGAILAPVFCGLAQRH